MPVTTRKVVEGPTNLILHVFLESNGVDGELVNYPILSPSECVPVLANQPSMRVVRIWYSMVWFDITFSWGGLVPRPFWTIARDTVTCVDFEKFGGMIDYATVPPSDDNGKLLITTNNFEPAGSQGSLALEIRKL